MKKKFITKPNKIIRKIVNMILNFDYFFYLNKLRNITTFAYLFNNIKVFKLIILL